MTFRGDPNQEKGAMVPLPARAAMQWHPWPPAPADEVSGTEADWFSLAEFGKALRRRSKLLAGAMLAGLAGAALWTYQMPRIYRAAASLEIQGVNEEFLDLRRVDPAARITMSTAEAYMHTQAEIVQDEALVGRVVDRLSLDKVPEFVPGQSVMEKIGSWDAKRGASAMSPRAAATRTAKARLLVLPSRQSRVIRVSFDAGDPALAAAFINELFEVFIANELDARERESRQVESWLQPQVAALRERLSRSEAALDSYARQRGLLLSADRESVAEDRLRGVQRDLATATADRIAKQSLAEMAARSAADSFPAVLDTGALREYQLRLTELRRQYAELSSLFLPDSYRVARVKAQIDEVEAARRREIEGIPKRAQADYEAATRRESLLTAQYAEQSALVASQAPARTHYDTLKREVDGNRLLYEAMAQKAAEARIASAVKPTNARVVSRATPPAKPHRPNVPLNLGVGLAGGLCLGLAGAAMLERTNRALRGPGDATQYLSVPELGAVPSAGGSHGAARLLHPFSNGNSGSHVELVTWENKLSAVSESFRNILVSIAYRTDRRAMLFTSACQGEGKTTVVSNMGIALAEIGKRVLLVDCDTRNPRLHEIFNLANSWGLTNILEELTATEQLPIDVLVRKTTIPNLSVLPSGPASTAVTGMLFSERMAALLGRFRSEFDFVLMDAPPALQFADARVAAHHADGVVLVVRANRTPPDVVKAATDRFQLDRIAVIGAVLNDWDMRHEGDYYGYRRYASRKAAAIGN